MHGFSAYIQISTWCYLCNLVIELYDTEPPEQQAKISMHLYSYLQKKMFMCYLLLIVL